MFRGDNLTLVDRAAVLTFDGPARAVRAANSIVGLANRLDIGVCCGIDTGMCDIGQRTLEGAAVDRAREVSAAAAFAEVFVTDTVMSLVSGSGLLFLPKSSSADSEIAAFTLVESS